jgi:hypothetical protein
VNIKNLEGRFRKRFRLKNLENALRWQFTYVVQSNIT